MNYCRNNNHLQVEFVRRRQFGKEPIGCIVNSLVGEDDKMLQRCRPLDTMPIGSKDRRNGPKGQRKV